MELTISLNPYDIARLAANKGVSTTELIAGSVNPERQTLLRRADGGCTFLGDKGCTVHSDRPLPCRLYPLARRSTARGEERFVKLPPDPKSTGECGNAGTVGEYLQSQQVERHTQFADRYLQFFAKLLERLKDRASPTDKLRDLALDHLSVFHQLLSNPSRAALVAPLFDMDRFLARYAETHSCSIPLEIDAKTEMHLVAIEEWLQRLLANP